MRFDGVWFRYGRRADWTLQAIDATVEPGRTVVVLGRNGAGKSTLLQLAAGVLRPSRGAVLDRPPVIGWVPERFPADQPFTAGDYLHRMAEVRGQDPRAADEWIERLLLTEHTGTRLADLSKGTAQKVGLAQALTARPGLLILDEPWEGLDAVARTLIPEIVAEVTGAGGIVLVSDHRGEIATLPEATHWTIADATLSPAPPPSAPPSAPARPPARSHDEAPSHDEVVIEVAVPRATADRAVAELRATGHRVLRVRDEAGAPAGPQARDKAGAAAGPQARDEAGAEAGQQTRDEGLAG
ncbi:ABC transporter ATP-binding protein [Actinoplanes sp. M2I2]|uniref:ATP-binding cassette domain-containing protein n=1 Tax=Actinoplanes sp. M2I2 TaxID=1734444 RepID=UPI00202036AA|nr:ABC transporter ATP-binding protein [Actinoplanes sp. M2I2]